MHLPTPKPSDSLRKLPKNYLLDTWYDNGCSCSPATKEYLDDYKHSLHSFHAYHILREGNQPANWLAGHGAGVNVFYSENTPTSTAPIL